MSEQHTAPATPAAQTVQPDIHEHCTDLLIHPAHPWTTSIQMLDEDGQPTDWWEHVEAWCEGNDDQDDPFDRFECCEHCAATTCPRRDGHASPCKTCRAGQTMLGESILEGATQ